MKAFEGYRALVVEDQSLPRMAYAANLKDAGFRVWEAATKSDALELIDLVHFHLAWIDLGLAPPEVDPEVGFADKSGLDIIDYIEEQPHETFAFIVTQRDNADSASEALRFSGKRDYITKSKIEEIGWTEIFERIRSGFEAANVGTKTGFLTKSGISAGAEFDKIVISFQQAQNGKFVKRENIAALIEVLQQSLGPIRLGHEWSVMDSPGICRGTVFSLAEGRSFDLIFGTDLDEMARASVYSDNFCKAQKGRYAAVCV